MGTLADVVRMLKREKRRQSVYFHPDGDDD